MNTEHKTQEDGQAITGVQKRRLTRYSAQKRAELIEEYEKGGESQEAFCVARGVKVTTFKGWLRKRPRPKAKFVKMGIPASSPAPIEICLVNGTRIGIRHQGSPEELATLIRMVTGC